MTSEQFDKLLDLIKAIVAEATSRDTSDGGLTESIRLSEVEWEARALFVTEEE